MRRTIGKTYQRASVIAAAVLLCGFDGGVSFQPTKLIAAEDSAKDAATIEEAAKVLDLRTLPLPEGATVQHARHIGSLSYEIKGDLKKAFQFQQQQLTQLGWKELPGSMTEPTYCSANFQKTNFLLSVMSYDGSTPEMKGTAQVFINNLGNVRLSKVPAVKGAKALFLTDANASYVTTLKPAEASAATRKVLIDAGWEPFGFNSNPPDSEVLIFRRNAIRLIAFVGVAPAQGGQVVISYSASLMAADIPAPFDAEKVDFADATKTLQFESSSDLETVAKFYQERLAKRGWKSTTDALTKQQNRFGRPIASQVFRNQEKDLLLLELESAEGKSRAKLTHYTAAEFAALEEREKAAAQKFVAETKGREETATKKGAAGKSTRKAPTNSDDGFPDVEKLAKDAIADALKDSGISVDKVAKGAASKKGAGVAKDKDAVSIPIPKEAKKVTQTSGNVLQIKLPAGKGEGSAKFIRDQLLAADWEMDDDDEIDETSGNVTFTKANKKVTLTFVDTGLADVNLMLIAFGANLEAGKADPNVIAAKSKEKPDAKSSTKSVSKKPNVDDADKPVEEPERAEKPKRGIAKLPQLPNEGKVTVNKETVVLSHIIAYEVIANERWITKVIATEKPIKQASLLAMLQKSGRDEGFNLPEPNLRLELDDQDRPNSLSLVAKMTPGGVGSSGLKGEAIVEEGRARGTFKLAKPGEFFDRTYTAEISFDVPVLTRNSKPVKQLANAPKLENSGKMLIDGKSIKLANLVAYEVKVFDEKRTAILFTEKPINLEKLKAALKKDGTDSGLFEFTAQVKVEIDKDDRPAAMHMWANNASLNSNSDLIGDVIVEDGRARGTVKLGKPAEFFDKKYSFDLTFDIEVLPLPESAGE